MIVIAVLALSLGCSKQEVGETSEFKNPENVTSQFVYRNLDGSGRGDTPVMVTEFITKNGKHCVAAQANYMYDSSKVTLDCD